MSQCRNDGCRKEIIWFPDNNGGYNPPVEKISEALPTDVVEALHSYREIMALVDGELISVRASGLYVRHRCYEPPEETSEFMAHAEENRDVYANDCPTCEVTAGNPCVYPNGKQKKIPHVNRIRLAYGSEN